MDGKKLDQGKEEAERFLAIVEDLKENGRGYEIHGNMNFEPGKLTGAVRRASMDLTRALSKFRSYR